MLSRFKIATGLAYTIVPMLMMESSYTEHSCSYFEFEPSISMSACIHVAGDNACLLIKSPGKEKSHGKICHRCCHKGSNPVRLYQHLTFPRQASMLPVCHRVWLTVVNIGIFTIVQYAYQIVVYNMDILNHIEHVTLTICGAVWGEIQGKKPMKIKHI